MKSVFVFCLSAFFLVSCQSFGAGDRPVYENHKNDWERFNLKGKVKQVTYISQEVHANPANALPVILEKYVLRFTEQGMMESLETFFPDGNLKDKKTYTYTDQQQMSKETVFNANNEVFSETNYYYDAAGDNIRKKEVLDGVLYDHFYRYDSLHNPIIHLQFQGKDTLDAIITNTYDAEKRLIQSSHVTTRDGGKNNMTVTYAYDANGNKIEESRARVGFEITKFIQTYDAKNRLTSIQHTLSGRLIEETRFDKNYNPESLTRFGDTGEIVSYAYTYTLDKTGNWIGRKTQLIRKFGAEEKDNRPYSEETRTIEYYK